MQFNRSLRRGFVDNAAVDPPLSSGVRDMAEDGEDFAVLVIGKNGTRYWFSDRRVLKDDNTLITTLFRYDEIEQVHWISKDWLRQAMDTPDPQQAISDMKTAHRDRILVELRNTGRPILLDGLGHSYLPVWEFLRLRERFDAITS